MANKKNIGIGVAVVAAGTGAALAAAKKRKKAAGTDKMVQKPAKLPKPVRLKKKNSRYRPKLSKYRTWEI